MDIILASTSPYRKLLLERLQVPFRCVAPDTDETPLSGEQPADLAHRLARAKARSIATIFPEALVIGSDQVASVDGQMLNKPGSQEVAAGQLRASAGKDVQFFTGLALVCLNRGLENVHVEPFSVHFRQLSDAQITNYLHRERPYDCAGSFKIEGLGIALFDSLEGKDPTSLEGLPLIALTRMLQDAGIQILHE
jgi:septum formation protein